LAGQTISNTITSTVTLGSANYLSPLYIGITGLVAPTSGAAAIYGASSLSDFTLTNDGTIAGGAGINHGKPGSFVSITGGAGGQGLAVGSLQTLINQGSISGGTGGSGSYTGAGGAGGAGGTVSAAAFYNYGSISGGNGGKSGPSAVKSGAGGAGGDGIDLSHGTIFGNQGLIAGGNGGASSQSYGNGGAGGAGGAGASLTNVATVTNSNAIAGGAGGTGGGGGGGTPHAGAGGNGGNGLDDINSPSAASLANTGSILGGAGGTGGSDTAIGGTGGAGGIGVVLSGAATLTNSGSLAGGAGGKGGTDSGNSYSGSNGGAGGAGLTLSGSASLLNIGAGIIAGGAGGAATSGLDQAGAGGAGADGVDASTSGSITNSGTIFGGSGTKGGNSTIGQLNFSGGAGGAGGTGIAVSAALRINNSGQIQGGAGGASGVGATGKVGGAGGAGVILVKGDVLTNSGLIAGGAGGTGGSAPFGANGGAGGSGIYLNGATLINEGTIDGGAGGAGGLTNAGGVGTGNGSAGAAGDAVLFGQAAAATLIIEAGAVFNGNVVANMAVDDVLEFSGTSATSLLGIGTQFQNFTEIDFAAGAAWTIGGNSIGLATNQKINGFSLGDTIDLSGITATSGIFANDVLTLVSNASVVAELNIVEAGGVTSSNFLISSDGSGGTDIAMKVPCFADGTRILRADGRLVPVEHLRQGDEVVLHGGGTAPIKWLGRRWIDLSRHPYPEKVQPIVIIAGALGAGLPGRDLVVSPDHALYLQGCLIPAKALLNGFTVRQLNRPHVTYYHVELPSHAVILAEGAAAESYLESGNRGAFENGGPAVALHPDFGMRLRLAKSCAPFAEAGPIVEAVRAEILQRAAIATTDDPALMIRHQNGAAIISSRAAVPGEIFADPRDRRQLGVKVARLMAGGQVIRLDHPELTQGWHDIEADGRWTNGHALIPPGLIPPGAEVTLALAATMRYPVQPDAATSPKTARAVSLFAEA
jgi:hypothetical protein